MILEWTNQWHLTTPKGTLYFNEQIDIEGGSLPDALYGAYLLDPSLCQAGTARRITRTNIAQANGEITHRKFRSGFVLELTCELWEDVGDSKPACGATLRAMGDLLGLHLNAIENNDGRIIWTPTSGPYSFGNRMVDKVRSLGPSGQGGEGGFVSVAASLDPSTQLTTVTFALLSPLPYEMDETEISTDLATTGAIVTQGGNTNFYPVIKVYGPASVFTIENLDALDEAGNPLKVVYDDTLPGAVSIAGGHYAEFDFFRNTVYLDGSGANLKAGVDILQTDFWPLVPGPNAINVTGYSGPSMPMLWQNAYA